MYPYREIGARLKKLRGSLSQAVFAAILSIKQPQYNRYEVGKVKPPLNIIQTIADYAQVSVDWILTGNIEQIDGTGILENVADMMEVFEESEAIPKASVSNDELAIIKSLRLLPQHKSIEILRSIIQIITNDKSIHLTRYQKEQLFVIEKIIQEDRSFTHGIDYDALVWHHRDRQKRLHRSTKKNEPLKTKR